MDDKKIQSALQDALETKIPSASVHLWPRVMAGFTAGENRQREKLKMNPIRRKFVLAVLAATLLLTLVMVTPQGHAIAQRMFQFFSVTSERSFPIPTDQVFPVPQTLTPQPSQILPVVPVQEGQPVPTSTAEMSCSSAASQGSYICQVKAAEAQTGFNAKEFLYDPKGMKFSTVTVIPGTKEIDMEFVVATGGGYLYLRQGISDLPEQTNAWGEVPADAVEQVSVNGLYAEIVSGGFMVYPDSTSAVWEPGGQLRLAWRDGSHWFVLEKMGDPYPIEWITKDQLIRLAEELVDDRPGDAVPPLDPEYLTTVEQAEALAGFDIPTPSMLPAGYELKRAAWTDGAVRLMYGPKGETQSELFIFLGQINQGNRVGPCSECPPGVSETVQVGPWQGWYWRGIFQSTTPAAADQPAPTPVWAGDASHWSLAWNSETFWFSMFYSPAYNSGREANQEMLIKIAESLK